MIVTRQQRSEARWNWRLDTKEQTSAKILIVYYDRDDRKRPLIPYFF